jgi:hypothetical protein
VNKQLVRLIEIYSERGFTSIDNFNSYQNTNSIVNFLCDKGHICNTKARYVLYENTGCKTCQYIKKQSLKDLNIELKFTKICSSCNEEKGKSSFGKLSSTYDGLRNICKLCRRKTTIIESVENKKKRSNSSFKYFKNNPFKSLYSRCLSSTNKKGFTEFNIDSTFLEELFIRQSGKCYWSGIKMCKDSVGLGKLNTISVDRIDCNIGYTKSNVVLACKFINLGRSNTDKDIFKSFLLENFKINNLLK